MEYCVAMSDTIHLHKLLPSSGGGISNSTPNRGFGGGHHRGNLSLVWCTVTIPYGGLKLRRRGQKEVLRLQALRTDVLPHLGAGSTWHGQTKFTLEETCL